MGRFLEYERNDRPYDRSRESDWFLGNTKERFKFRYKWIYQDHIWWRDDYVREPKKINRIPIRKWCEANLTEDVFIRSGDERDIYYPDPEKNWEYTWYSKYWIEFCFETEEDLSHFLIKWV